MGVCRFCGTTSNSGVLAIGNVCADPDCQVSKTLPLWQRVWANSADTNQNAGPHSLLTHLQLLEVLFDDRNS